MLDRFLNLFPSSRILERRNVFLLFREHFDQANLQTLRKQDFIHWFEKIKQQNNYRDRTLKSIKSAINHFIKWLKDENLIESNPLSEIRFTKREPPRKVRVILSKNEIATVLEEAKRVSPTILYGYLLCLVHTGCRRSEINNLTWDDVDFDNMFLDIKNTKNGVDRKIKIARALFDHLSSCQRTSAYVCPNPQGKKLGRKHFDNELSRLQAISQIKKKWSPHDLRHSFAYNFLKQGGSMYQLQAILGHKNISMTIDLYGHLKASDIENPSPYD